MTEKGNALHLQKLLADRNTNKVRLYTQLSVIDTIINTDDYDVDRASSEHDLFIHLHHKFQIAHSKCEVLQSEEEKAADDKVAEKVDEDVSTFSALFKQWVHSRRAETIKSKSRSSKSRSSKSRSSKLSDKAAQERAKIAELEIERGYQEEIERKKKEYDQIQRDFEIAKAQARLKAYENELEEITQRDRSVEATLNDLPKQNQFTYVRQFVNQLPDDPASPEEEELIQPNTKTFEPTNVEKFSNLSRMIDTRLNKLDVNVTSSSSILHHSNHDSMYTYSRIQPVGTRTSSSEQKKLSFTLPNYSNQQKLPPIRSEEIQVKSSFPQQESNQMMSIVNELQAPKVVLDVFTGNAMDFPFFITSFEEAVERKVPDGMSRLQRLMNFVDGSAKELVQSCIYLPSDKCYERAKQLLKERYGNPYIVNAEYRKHLTSWPRLKANDIASFTSFENFLIKYQSSMQAIGRGSDGSIELLQLLQTKLPSYLQDRWSRQAYQIRKELKREATIDDFIKRFHEETEIISDPLFSRDAITEVSKGNSREQQNKPKTKTFGIGAKEVQCACCGRKNHDLEKCFKFNKLNLQERKNIVFKSRLCFRCLAPITDSHIGKSCKKPRRCTICNQQHPTCLHQDKSSKDDQPTVQHDQHTVPVTSAFVSQSNDVGLCIVLVKVTHPDVPYKSVTTLALLDNGSQGTFVSDDLIKELGIRGSNTCLEIHTVNGKAYQTCQSINGLKISSFDNETVSINLPKSYSRSTIPVDPEDIPTPSKLMSWKYLHPILKHLPPDGSSSSVGILIGSNCPRALEPLSVIRSEDGGPYATRTKLGWCVTGPMGRQCQSSQHQLHCNRINVKSNDSSHYFNFKEVIKDVSIRESMLAMYHLDFHEVSNQIGLSIDDEKFLKIMKTGKHIDNRFHLPLPLRNPDKMVPNNRTQVLHRAHWLKKKLTNNTKMLDDYTGFMKTLLDKGHVKVAEKSPTPNRTWYIPHFAVYHPQKPDKIRIVFDCSAEYNSYCLNKELLQGPDMTNQLIGVLTRFRQDSIAVMADIETMFHQVCVEDEYHDYLRFLSWPDGDLSKEPVDYQMCVHLQGATSSPSCANYALRETAKMYRDQFGEDAANTLVRNFYVDDMLKSFPESQTAIKTIPNVVNMLNAGGFRLTKFHSNDRALLSTIPEEEKSKRLKNLDMSSNPIPEERALGMNWCPESDKFSFKIKLKEKPITRRGVLSTISSIYDPLGIVSPYLLEGKKLLQQICVEKGWDDPLSPTQVQCWEKWKIEVKLLEDVIVDRCFHPSGFGEIIDSSLHYFSDASCDSYGQASYIRLVNDAGDICCKLIMAKSRVAPPKRPTIPRLELTAGVLSVKVSNSLHSELDICISNEFFWTDSQVVLAYIKNETKRFHLFVSNRIKFIRENSPIDHWMYVPSKENPADDTTRGLKFSNSPKDKRWISGPEFLYKSVEEWPIQPSELKIGNDDMEVKKTIKCNAVMTIHEYIISTLEQHSSRWYKMKRIVATILNWRFKPRKTKSLITVEDLQRAEIAIIRLVQRRAYEEEVTTLESNNCLKKSSQLIKLSPFLDENHILRVGGRVRNADVPLEIKHPIILPRKSISTNLIIEHIHQKIHHAGRNSTLNEARRCGYWIVNGNSLVRYILMKCVKCRILRGKSSTPKMADLPKDRLEPSPPFTYCGIDMFGPFIIRERRSDLKRYGIIFTCLNSRAVHFESVSSMETDSFLLCLRRFIGRRGLVRTIRCDNGTNFVGAKHELQKALQEMDTEKIKNYLLTLGTDFIINWIHNPPYASNFGGVWERLIRSARTILDGLMLSHGHSLNDESFRTFLVEVEAIINSRPLTTDGLNDPENVNMLSPINLLTMKSSVILPPPGNFQREDMYCRRRWRRVQHLSNEFWSKWRKEFLSQLQSRAKWTKSKRNIREDDIVLLRDDSHRNEWKRAIVTKVHGSDDGIVRTVTIKHNKVEYVRPVNKVVVLVENDC